MIPTDSILAASEFDQTITLKNTDLLKLGSKYLPPQAYTKKKLFDAMFHGKSIVFNNYPIQNIVHNEKHKTSFTLNLLKNNLKRNEKIFIRYGNNRTLKKVTIQEVIERWIRGRSKFGVTDLHFRDTKFFNKIDADSISYFNLLPKFTDEVSFLEMLTLVISSKGIFSDSHSDDGDGSNHCIIGKKLWLAWDKAEGQKVGLQDCTYDPVYDQANFSMQKFLQLKTAHWFLVQEGETLFMPGNFTHKVITLESYIGFGSFYVSFPNYFNSIRRWLFKQSSDVTPDFISSLNIQCKKYIQEEVTHLTEREKKAIGYDYFRHSLTHWQKLLTPKEKKSLQNNMPLLDLLNQH